MDGVPPSGVTRPLDLTDPAVTPPADLAQSTVDPAAVLLDTFDGGSVPLSEADPELVSRLFDAIAPIDAPEHETIEAGSEWLEPDDLVIGYVDRDEGAWAFPVRIPNLTRW